MLLKNKPCHSARPLWLLLLVLLAQTACTVFRGRAGKPDFRVIAFYTAKADLAHISFVHEANRWFADMAVKHHLVYDSTNNWGQLNVDFF